jgi:tyrosine-protein phosphatase non-receptor type 1
MFSSLPSTSRTPKTSDNKNNELRHRNRSARQEAMQDKIREIKRKQKESETLPKKRRSLILSIVSGVLILSVVAYFYVKT